MTDTPPKAQKDSKKSTKKAPKKGAKTAQKTPKKAQKVPKKAVKKTKTDKKKAPIASKSSKRARSDSVSVAVEAAQGAFKEIEPPAHVKLRKAEMPFWDSVIDEFALTEWTNHTLEMAAYLTRYLYDLDLEQRKMRKEGSILERKQIIPAIKDKETKQVIKEAEVIVTSTYINPRKQIIDTYTKNIIALRRNLSLHARATEGETRDVQKRRGKQKEIENGIKNADDKMGLISFPKVVK